jgi:hydrogenase maturation protease
VSGRRGGPIVIGIGNVLLRDDGIGPRVVDELRQVAAREPGAVPAGTRLVDGGTLGLELLSQVDGARSLVLVDAVDLGQPAGTVGVLRGDGILAAGRREGQRIAGGVGELLSVARLMGWLPEAVCLVGIQVGDTEAGPGLSEPVAAALPQAVSAALDELREPGGLTPALRPQAAAGARGRATA